MTNRNENGGRRVSWFRLRSYLVALREALKFWNRFPGQRSNKRVRIETEIKRVERLLGPEHRS